MIETLTMAFSVAALVINVVTIGIWVKIGKLKRYGN
jgi:hypothetical protein